MGKGIGGHQSAIMENDEWLTPPAIIKQLGEFDLDPCAPVLRPWDTAKMHYDKQQNGLEQHWIGRVWLNPPYGKYTASWLNKLADHGDGIALIFARTETSMFFDHVWNKANAVLFIKGRLFSHRVNGERALANAGAPSVLVAYGKDNAIKLETSNISGKFVKLNSQ